MDFQIHNVQTAQGDAKPILEASQKALGFVPNMYGAMAEAPALLKAYTTLSRILEESSLSATERQVVLLSVSYVNGCEYCVAAHSVIAGMQKVSPSVIQAIREGREIPDGKLEALRRFAEAVVVSRGYPNAGDVERFLGAGYGRAQILEVVLGVGMKTLSNYTNHIAKTPLDAAFAPAAWSKAA